ncbi:MAG: Trehalose utilization [Verrucomicrobiales bacterium]|nr:Trehalose utilization [Verrucomicrobiales bacterium]
MTIRPLLLFLQAAFLPMAAYAQAPQAPDKDAKILSEVKVPDGFDLTVFASPPQVNYPVYAAAAPDGTVYISSDKNGSLDRKGQRGSVVRLRDTDGDGRADEVKAFVPDVDSPRGLVWDHDRVILMHPPHLSAFIDHNGDGVADEQKILVKNIAFGFKDRPADHTSNGVTLGVDGWLYLAIGDFGFMEAEGTDGKKLQLRAGGVVRVRPDGTDLQLYSRGTRNILEVALSPTLEGFARDNTNDGGGWDMRFHQFTGLEEHGYPSLYMNFGAEAIQPIGNYGGGSGCGAGWLDEPGWPAGYQNVPLTVDWGKEWVFRHELSADGATYKDKAMEFIHLPRATDVDVDASSHLYATSMAGATFNYNGEDVGYVVRVTPKGYKAEALPDFAKLDEAGLVALLSSPSHRRRLEAQRTLLRRGLNPASISALEAFASNATAPLHGRAAALFTLLQGQGPKSYPFLTKLAADAALRPLAIRALGDRGESVPAEAIAVLSAGLKDALPRTRVEASVALTRLAQKPAAAAIAELLADADPTVSHTAVQCLIRLGAAEVCLAVVDAPGSTDPRRAGALRVLQSLHTMPVVEALTDRLKKETDSFRRRGLITALCRLSAKEGIWKGDSWGTRPDTSGPYYQATAWEGSAGIAKTMSDVLAHAPQDEAAYLLAEMSRHKMQDDAALGQVLTMAAGNPALVPVALAQLSRSERLPAEALPILLAAATAPGTSPADRVTAITVLAKADHPEAATASLTGLALLSKKEGAEKAATAFLASPKLENHHTAMEHAAEKTGGFEATWADAALLTLAARTSGSPEAKQLSQAALDKGWETPARRAQILQAITLTKQRSWSDRVLTALNDPDPAVLAAARDAAKTLKLDPAAAAAPKLATLDPGKILDAVLEAKGDAAVGQQIFLQAGCVACHTLAKDEPQRGPYLGTIADTYKRRELAEAILDPNKTIAQGFVTNIFEMADGSTQLGFVTTEAADKVVIRNVAAQEITLAVADIKKRDKLPTSLMPPGLLLNFTAKDFASLLDYLQSLAKK